MRRLRVACLVLISIALLAGCAGTSSDDSIVIWITGGLRGDWLPHAEYGQPLAGGLSQMARALELYRKPNDLLLDLGQFRYPCGFSGEIRRGRIKANGFLKALTRMRYNAINVGLQDLPPWPPELAARAREYDLPFVSSNVGADSLLFPTDKVVSHLTARIRIVALTGGSAEFSNWLKRLPDSIALATSFERSTRIDSGALTILLTDAPESQLNSFCDSLPEVDLILWLNNGPPVAKEIGGILVLGLGNRGNCLGRIEIRNAGVEKFSLQESDLSAWLDGKPYRHHPARESLLSRLQFWKKKPALRASIWAVPEELAPQKEAEAQRRQSNEAANRCAELEEIHRRTPTDFAGSRRCLDCHPLDHRRDLAKLHLRGPLPQVRDYPVYELCLPCHATGFDNPAGFLLPWERPDLLVVGCEACHEGGYTHALQGQAPYPDVPADSLCQDCHKARALPSDHPLGTMK